MWLERGGWEVPSSFFVNISTPNLFFFAMTYVQFQNTNPYSTRVIKTKSPLSPITNSKKIAKSSKKNFKIMIRRTSICSAQLYTQPQPRVA